MRGFFQSVGSISAVSAIACFPLLFVQIILPPTASALDAEELYRLCSSSPFNSQCKGYETPVSLENRPGKAGSCIFKNNQVENRGTCKIAVNETSIIIYQETGSELEVLNNNKSTRTVEISPTSVTRIQYREDSKNNTEAQIVNTLLFGLAGLLSTPKTNLSEIQISYTPNAPQDSNQEQAANSLTVVVERGAGIEMRFQLEKVTARQAETPRAKPEEQKPESAK
jgi:hypothetical protein